MKKKTLTLILGQPVRQNTHSSSALFSSQHWFHFTREHEEKFARGYNEIEHNYGLASEKKNRTVGDNCHLCHFLFALSNCVIVPQINFSQTLALASTKAASRTNVSEILLKVANFLVLFFFVGATSSIFLHAHECLGGQRIRAESQTPAAR